MLMAFRMRRPHDMPMLGTITRQGKGKYFVDIKFARSRRFYDSEVIFAADIKAARAHARKLYPTLKWEKK